MSRPQGTLRRDGQSGSSWPAGCPLPAPAPWVDAHLPEAKAGPRLEAAARAQATGGCSGPGGAGQVSAARGPGHRGRGVHCDQSLGALTSQNPFVLPGNSPTPLQHLAQL